jgi:hydroxyacylglutathione hydrolase
MKHEIRIAWVAGWLGMAAAAPLANAQGPLDMHWDPGAEDCTPAQARTQAHAIDETTIVIRQNPCVDYEAPLMYLLIGGEKALLIDSGATDDPKLVADLTELVSGYLTAEDGSRLPLVVTHTHGHQDHRAGDAAFAALPGTTVVPHEPEGLREYFGFDTWPNDEVRYDLGHREVVVAPTPGHHPDHVVYLDVRTRLLFTGDFYLPGRLLVDDIDAYRASAFNMVEFVATWAPLHALGAHVEMNTRGELYSGGATFHPDERPVPMPFGIQEANDLRQALEDFQGFYERHPEYAVVHPVHNLLALAAGVIVLIVLLAWGARRLIRRRRAASAPASS